MLAILMLIQVAGTPLQAAGESTAAGVTVTGSLVIRNGASFLAREAGEVPLTGSLATMAGTLLDKRIAGRELKLVGKARADGRFDVSDLFVVRAGKLLRLIYFCETCNITTFGPGICDCCREETLPVETPLNDPRVYHPGDREPPNF